MEKKVLADSWYNQASEEDKKLFREWVTGALRTNALKRLMKKYVPYTI